MTSVALGGGTGTAVNRLGELAKGLHGLGYCIDDETSVLQPRNSSAGLLTTREIEAFLECSDGTANAQKALGALSVVSADISPNSRR